MGWPSPRASHTTHAVVRSFRGVQVLRAMAGSKSRLVRQHFMQLHVLDMLVRELSLEYEMQQVRLPAVPALASGNSSSAGTAFSLRI